MENKNVNENTEENENVNVHSDANEDANMNMDNNVNEDSIEKEKVEAKTKTNNANSNGDKSSKNKTNKSSTGLIVGIIAAVVLIAVGSILYMFKPWDAFTDTNSVGKVDKLEISSQLYSITSKSLMSTFLTSNNITTEASKYKWDTKVKGETSKDSVKKDVLNQLHEFMILLTNAKQAGLKVEKTDVDNWKNNLIKDYANEAEAEKAIKQHFDVTLSEYIEVSKDNILIQKYLMQEYGKIKISDDEIKKYFEEHKSEYDQATVTHILIKTVDNNNQPLSEGKKAEAKKKADDILKQVQAGGDIKTLAEKYSEDKPAVTTNKGEYTFSKGKMVPEFENWAFASRKAGDTGIVETQYGYHVMQFHKFEEGKIDDVKNEIKQKLTEAKFSDEFQKKLDALKKEKKYAIVQNTKSMDKIDKKIYGF